MSADHTETRDLLIEIGCEDLPARYVRTLSLALAKGMIDGLINRSIPCEFSVANPGKIPDAQFEMIVRGHEDAYALKGDAPSRRGLEIFATPRRVAVLVAKVAARQPDQSLELVGPALAVALKDGQPTPAALGFAKKCGVSFAELGEKAGKLHYAKQQPGRATAELLPEIFEEALRAMDELVPKRMRWGAGEETFVRPVQWLLALLGSDVVPLRRFGLQAGGVTYGHRFHAPEAIALATPDEYATRLKAARVWADVASRRAEIRRQIEAEGQRLGGTPKISEDLLDEVTALVEWPVVISGRIEARFLELPPEVIVATVETNQRYFTVFAPQPQREGQMRLELGYLMPAFITISNIESKDVAQVIQGNERVVRPRLSDALFFWQQDLRQPLAAYGEKLESVTFQKELGSTAAKVTRTVALARSIASAVGADVEPCARAAQLAKCDLATKMVYEFPELQGLMGGYYAGKSGEPAPVATAIREHYQPTQAGTPIPSTVEGRIVALADKLDTLAGIFAIGQKPTASKDPYALRRAALGVLRILIEGELALDLRELLRQAFDLQPPSTRDEKRLDELWEFVINRFVGLCSDTLLTLQDDFAFKWVAKHPGKAFVQTWPITEIVESVKDMSGDPGDLMRRARAVFAFLQSPAARSLAAADKRARNILRQAGNVVGGIDAARLEHPAEQALAQALDDADAALAPLRAGADYAAMLARLAELKSAVDGFFDGVMVMAEDPVLRSNRLALLARLDALCREVADLSQLPG